MASWSTFAFFAALLITMVYGIFEDHRYPKYILEADTPCTQEGDFIHPKNCSWFYRCTDTLGVGFYKRFVFECAPGTVFNDTLDVCVTKTKANSCNGSGGGGSGDDLGLLLSSKCYDQNQNFNNMCIVGNCQGSVDQSACVYATGCTVTGADGKKDVQYCQVKLTQVNGKCDDTTVKALCAKMQYDPIGRRTLLDQDYLDSVAADFP